MIGRMKMITNYVDFHDQLEEKNISLGNGIPGPLSGLSRLHRKAMENGTIDGKTKELMALAISVTIRCEGCIAYHLHDAIQAGATRSEMLEAIGVAIMMGGAPASVYATMAVDAIDQYLNGKQ